MINLFGKNKKNCVTVIIPAAGSGARMGGVYKPLEALCGKPMLCYSLEVFENSDYVKRVVIAAREDKVQTVKKLCSDYGYNKVKSVISGGKNRQDSVKLAFKEAFKVKEDITKLVAIHDAARPLIKQKDAENAFEKALKYGSAVCAAKVRDTVKRADLSQKVTESIERDGLWLVQTPQVFDTDIYHTSLGIAEKNGTLATDDGSLVQEAGFVVLFSQSDSSNIKVTYPEDIALAEAVIRYRKDRKEI